MTKDTGGPAYPCTEANYTDPKWSFEGMTLRDYFASRAPHYPDDWFLNYCRNRGFQTHQKALADWSYEYADAMLEARK